MEQAKTVTISEEEYLDLKKKAEIDVEFLKQMAESLKDIKEGKVRRVK